MKDKTEGLVRAGAVAALYTLLTLLSSAAGLASGPVQLRLSEALCILPCFFPEAVPGLTLGCLLANMLSGCPIWDVVFGTLATFVGAVGTRALRKHRYGASLPPILANMLIIPPVLARVYHIDQALPLMMLTVGAGELISCGLLGQLLHSAVSSRFEIQI